MANWTSGPDGLTTEAHGCKLRVSWKLNNGRYAYFVHKPGDANQTRGEEQTVMQSQDRAISLAMQRQQREQ